MPFATYQELKRNKKVKYWHEAIIDDIIARPFDFDRVRAQRLGYSEKYLNAIINSDMFRARLAERRARFAERLDTTLIHKTAECASEALDLLLAEMREKRTSIPFDKLADFADKSLARLGYGNSTKPAAVQVNVDARSAVAVTPEDLARARTALRAVESQRAIESSPNGDDGVDVSSAATLESEEA